MDTEGKITVPIFSDNILREISQADTPEVNIAVTVPDSVLNNYSHNTNLILTAETLQAAKDSNKDLTVSVKDSTGQEKYAWTFNEEDLTSSKNEQTDVNLSLNISSIDSNTTLPAALEEGAHGFIIEFGYDGVLPSPASLRIYVGDQAGVTEGSKIYLYHYNSDTGLLETLPNSSEYVIDENGYITVSIVHCSDYVVLMEKAKARYLTSLRDQITVEPMKKTLYTGKTDNKVSNKINLPSTLKLVESLSDQTSKSVIGGVTVSYQSGNSKIAEVDQNGIITAKSPGKATIYTVITLYSGKIKTVKTLITVKKPYIKFTASPGLIKTGESFCFKIKAYGLDSNDIIWTTSKKSVLSIDSKTGKATAITAGTEYVIATIGNISSRIKVTVK